MNRGFGGAHPRMHESIINAENVYLGIHEHTISVGDAQSFIFEPKDAGPFWMTEEERNQPI
jgi:hypothetical protein